MGQTQCGPCELAELRLGQGCASNLASARSCADLSRDGSALVGPFESPRIRHKGSLACAFYGRHRVL